MIVRMLITNSQEENVSFDDFQHVVFVLIRVKLMIFRYYNVQEWKDPWVMVVEQQKVLDC